MGVGGSILDEADIAHAIEVAQGLGPLRMCFAIAGGGVPGGGRVVNRDGSPHALEPFVKTVELNLVGTFNTVRLVAAAMGTLEPANEDGERGRRLRTISSEVPLSPCEQPAPAIRANSLPPGPNATSATPLTLFIGGALWLDGSPDATTVLVPWREILEMLAVNPPV